MMLLVVLTMGVLGGTTWLAMNQSVAGNPSLNRRLTSIGIGLSLVTGAFVVLMAVVGGQ
jgi:hypothetical protein